MKNYVIHGSLGTYETTNGEKYEDVFIVVRCYPNAVKRMVRLMSNYDGGLEYREATEAEARALK